MGHNFRTVLAFEVRRTLLKPQFWLATLAVPLLFAFVMGLMWFSNSSAIASQQASRDEKVTFTYSDASGVVLPEVARGLGGSPSLDPDADAAAVRAGRADLFIAVPVDPKAEPVRVVARDRGLVENGVYSTIATDLVRQSARAGLDNPTLTGLATGSVATEVTAWKDGHRVPGWESAIVPGIFLVLLYLTVILLGNQMLNITVEEKENRVTEMILTTIRPTVLIVGKVVAVLLVGLVQVLVVGVPTSLLAALMPGVMSAEGGAGGPGTEGLPGGVAPSADALVFSPWPIVLGALLFLGGLLMFAGLLVAIGSVMPTAKDASGAFGVVVLAMFLPVYAGALLVSQPYGVASRVLTFFPLTAPVTTLLRNATGSLGVVEGLLALAAILGFAALFLGVGVRLFREGSIAYGSRMTMSMVRASLRRRNLA